MRRLVRSIAGLFCVSFCWPLVCLAATISLQSGDIVSYVTGIPLPGAGSQGFVVPTDASIAAWRLVVAALYTGKYQSAADLADPLNYNLVKFTDTKRSRDYYVLVERTNVQGAPMRGLGTYVYNPTACRSLSFHAPHAGGDENTRPEAATLFADLNAAALLVAGTHRCANAAVSSCDGSSTACGDGAFHVSDVAHYTQNYFEPAHEEISKALPGLTTVAVHGEGGHSPEIILSNGSCFSYPSPSSVTLLSNQYNSTLQKMGISLASGTCSSGSGNTSLCAEVDVQGRYSNGSASLCNCVTPTKSACSTTLGCGRTFTFPEKFIHLEQTCQLREVPGCAVPGVGYQTAVSVFAAVFPCSPRISAVVQGASFKADPLAPGSFFSVFGDGLGTQDAPSGAAAAFTLGGLGVQICGVPARLVYTSGQGQVNAVVPIEVAGKTSCSVTAAMTAGGYVIPPTTASATAPIVPQNIAIFPYSPSATLSVPIITNASYQLIGPPGVAGASFVQAQKGSTVILWATGGGLTTPAVPDNQVAPSTGAVMTVVPRVTIAGSAASVPYAGMSPGFIGLYQINVTIPPGTPSGKVTMTLASGIGDVNYDLWVQ